MKWWIRMKQWLACRPREDEALARLRRASAENEAASQRLWTATLDRYEAASEANEKIAVLRATSEASLQRIIEQREEHRA